MSVVAQLDYAAPFAPGAVAAPAAIAACEVRASLIIAGFDGDPDAVSAHLDLQPAQVSRRSGGLYRALRLAGPGHNDANEWVFRPALDLPEPRPARLALAELLRPLRDALEPRRDRLATLPRCSREIRIEIVPHGAAPTIAFADGDLDFLACLGLSWTIDVRTVTA